MDKKLKIIYKIMLGYIILIIIICFVGKYIQEKNDITKNTKSKKIEKINYIAIDKEIDYAISNDELCVESAFNMPTEQEIDFNNRIKEDKFVQYLRTILDKFLDGDIPDDDYFSFEDSSRYTEYMKSKFIVLSTDIAPGGGESIIIMFKDKPDKVFYAWIYDNLQENYSLKEFSEYNITKSGKSSIKETQEIFINQLCDKNFGI